MKSLNKLVQTNPKQRNQKVTVKTQTIPLNKWLQKHQLTLHGHIKSAQQRTVIQQYGDWYTGR